MRRLLPFVIVLAGCGFKYEPTSPSDPVEEALISETSRGAAAMGVEVRGEITDTISSAQVVPGQLAPTAWYSGGVAWFYRPRVKVTVSLTPEPGKETARNVAVHEVCHARHYHHDLAHWECMNKWAQPTYPRPGSGSMVSSLSPAGRAATTTGSIRASDQSTLGSFLCSTEVRTMSSTSTD